MILRSAATAAAQKYATASSGAILRSAAPGVLGKTALPAQSRMWLSSAGANGKKMRYRTLGEVFEQNLGDFFGMDMIHVYLVEI
jgi:hypothetical protein